MVTGLYCIYTDMKWSFEIHAICSKSTGSYKELLNGRQELHFPPTSWHRAHLNSSCLQSSSRLERKKYLYHLASVMTRIGNHQFSWKISVAAISFNKSTDGTILCTSHSATRNAFGKPICKPSSPASSISNWLQNDRKIKKPIIYRALNPDFSNDICIKKR